MPPRATSPRLSPAIDELARTLRDFHDRLDRVERGMRTHQLDLATVENGSIQFTDSAGVVRSLLGIQPDGTFAHAHFNSGSPVSPDVPVISSGINSLSVTWDGFMSDGSAPLADFAHVEIHIGTSPVFTPADSNLAGHLYRAGTFVIPGLTPGTTYYITLVAVSTSGVASQAGTYTAATPSSVASQILPGQITATQLGFSARSIGGITTTIQATPPANPQLGDLWYDISNNNLLNTWNGSQWVPYQFGTNAIAVGSITAQLIAAGTIIAGSVDGTTITGAKFVATGTSGEILAYNGIPAAGNLVLAVSPVAGSDIFGNSYFAGVTTYNGFGAVVNLLSTDHAAFFQYQNLGSASQGTMILSVASASGTDPVTGASYGVGMFGVDPVFGDYMSTTGANITMGIGIVITRTGGVRIQAAPVNSQNPYLRVDAPEQTTTSHMQMLLQGTSPDGTAPGQALLGLVSGSAVLSPITNAMLEVQDSTGGGGINIIGSVASPSQAEFGIYSAAAGTRALSVRVTGDTNSRWRADSNGKQEWGGGGAGAIDTNLYRGAANLLRTDDALAFTDSGAPAAVSGAVALYATTSSQLAYVNPAGLTVALRGGHVAAVNVNTITGAAFANLTADTIPALDAIVGATYKMTAFGYGVWGSTQQQLNISARFGASPGAGTDVVGITPGIAATALAASAGFQWRAEVVAVCVTTGATATWRLSVLGCIQQTGNALLPGTAAQNTIPFSAGTGNTDITQDSTAAIMIGISAKWAATTGAPTISKTTGYFERIA